jgi:hypothetical protein
MPPTTEGSTSFAEHVPALGRSPAGVQTPTDRVQVASWSRAGSASSQPQSGRIGLSAGAEAARSQARRGTRTVVDTQRYWAAHEARIREINAKLSSRRGT